MPMTPKEALAHIEEPLTHVPVVPGGCPECLGAISALRALVEQPTVAEVREEIVRRKKDREEKRAPLIYEPCHSSSVWAHDNVIRELGEFLDFIDRKGE